jgi:hypothetical protein
MKMEQTVPKRRHIKFRGRGITQKKIYNEIWVVIAYELLASLFSRDSFGFLGSKRFWACVPKIRFGVPKAPCFYFWLCVYRTTIYRPLTPSTQLFLGAIQYYKNLWHQLFLVAIQYYKNLWHQLFVDAIQYYKNLWHQLFVDAIQYYKNLWLQLFLDAIQYYRNLWHF